MSPRSRSLASLTLACVLAAPLLPAQFASAQEKTPEVALPDVANAKYQFTGTINANSVYVRSGPGENYYPTLKLEKGASITVVGIKFDWLKIVPPEGSFSYVAKAYVEKRGDGSVGRIIKPDLNVRAGSSIVSLKTTVQTKLSEGLDVKILGEQDEYYKIAPPTGSFVYVNKQFVEPGKPLTSDAVVKHEDVDPISSAPVPMKTETPTQKTEVASNTTPTTQPVAGGSSTATETLASTNTTPTTQPVAQGPTIEQKFDKLESDFLAASKQSIQDQPLTDLKTSYESLTADSTLPVGLRRMAELRLVTIKMRLEAQQQFADAKKLQDEANSKSQAMKAEQDELAQRIKENTVTVYTAIGTLRQSSLQQGSGTLYRLTDPSTGRTLAYIRGGDTKTLSGLMNQLVGVKGELSVDNTLNARTVAPTSLEAVDINKVNKGITATLLPPSMVTKTQSQPSQITQAGDR